MDHLAWLSVTGLSCGSSGLVVCDRSELWFIWLGCLGQVCAVVHLAWLYVTGLSSGSSGLVVCDRSELWFIWLDFV